MVNYALLIILLLLSMQSLAVIETYSFSNDEHRQRYHVFIEELRCPKCQNQNLSGSNSPIAKDLRRELYRLIEEGSNDEQINRFMVERYGNFILYRPPLDKNTVALWLFPFIVGVIALLLAFKVRVRASRPAKASLELSDNDRYKIAELIEHYGEKKLYSLTRC